MREVWVETKGYPDYLVSNRGGVVERETYIPIPEFMNKGRPAVNIKDGTGRNGLVMVHRLVAASFYDGDIGGLEVNHIDGDKLNNAIWNLEVVTREANEERAYEKGLTQRPVRVENLDTGEVYPSLVVAGRKLGYLSALPVPRSARESGEEFRTRGYRLKVV